MLRGGFCFLLCVLNVGTPSRVIIGEESPTRAVILHLIRLIASVLLVFMTSTDAYTIMDSEFGGAHIGTKARRSSSTTNGYLYSTAEKADGSLSGSENSFFELLKKAAAER